MHFKGILKGSGKLIVECPYCGEDIEVDDSNLYGLTRENYIEDYECDNCGKEFDVYVEFNPVGSAEEIKYQKCDYCGKKYKTRNLYKRGSTFPFPKDERYSALCHMCYAEQIGLEWDKKKENK